MMENRKKQSWSTIATLSMNDLLGLQNFDGAIFSEKFTSQFSDAEKKKLGHQRGFYLLDEANPLCLI
jgi:hypothetical protein